MSPRPQHRLALFRLYPFFQQLPGLVQAAGAQQQAYRDLSFGRPFLPQRPRLKLVLFSFIRPAAIDEILGQQVQEPGPALAIFLAVRKAQCLLQQAFRLAGVNRVQVDSRLATQRLPDAADIARRPTALFSLPVPALRFLEVTVKPGDVT